MYRKNDSSMEPQSLTYQQIQNDLNENNNSNRSEFQLELLNNLKSERDRRNFINEARNNNNNKNIQSETYWTTGFQN